MRFFLVVLCVCWCHPACGQNGAASGELRRDNHLQMPFAWCQPGRFEREWYGKHPAKPGLGPFREPVRLTRGFWIGQYEVTQAEWQSVMGNRIWEITNAKKPAREREAVPNGDRYPVTLLSWEDAVEFCERFMAAERAAGRLPEDEVYRLPTEAEWEWACRAGAGEGLFCCGDSHEELREYAWFSPSGRGLDGQLHEVGQKLPNRWGLFDMHGNAAELCLDEYLPWSAFGDDPCCRAGNSVRNYRLHVTKGGHYSSRPVGCESSVNGDTGIGRPRGELAWIGFRVVRGHRPIEPDGDATH